MARYILGRQAQNRSKMIRYTVVIGLLLFFMAIIQTSVISRVKPFGVSSDVMISVVMGISFFCGCYTGAIVGIAAGFLTDALASVGLSVLPMIYLLIGYVVGYYVKALGGKGYLSYLICLGIILPVRFLITLIMTLISVNGFHFPTFLITLALPELLGTAIFGLLLYFPIWGICAWLKRRD